MCREQARLLQCCGNWEPQNIYRGCTVPNWPRCLPSEQQQPYVLIEPPQSEPHGRCQAGRAIDPKGAASDGGRWRVSNQAPHIIRRPAELRNNRVLGVNTPHPSDIIQTLVLITSAVPTSMNRLPKVPVKWPSQLADGAFLRPEGGLITPSPTPEAFSQFSEGRNAQSQSERRERRSQVSMGERIQRMQVWSEEPFKQSLRAQFPDVLDSWIDESWSRYKRCLNWSQDVRE